MTTELAAEIIKMDLKTLYQNYKALHEQGLINEEDYEEVRYGKELDVDIHDMIEEEDKDIGTEEKYIILYRRKQQAYIGKTGYKLRDYRTEKENRMAKMRNTLLDNLEDGNPWQPIT